ncbi:hypothetical protein THAOC_11080, partial [Thalassiosira oceanica]
MISSLSIPILGRQSWVNHFSTWFAYPAKDAVSALLTSWTGVTAACVAPATKETQSHGLSGGRGSGCIAVPPPPLHVLLPSPGDAFHPEAPGPGQAVSLACIAVPPPPPRVLLPPPERRLGGTRRSARAGASDDSVSRTATADANATPSAEYPRLATAACLTQEINQSLPHDDELSRHEPPVVSGGSRKAELSLLQGLLSTSAIRARRIDAVGFRGRFLPNAAVYGIPEGISKNGKVSPDDSDTSDSESENCSDDADSKTSEDGSEYSAGRHGFSRRDLCIVFPRASPGAADPHLVGSNCAICRFCHVSFLEAPVPYLPKYHDVVDEIKREDSDDDSGEFEFEIDVENMMVKTDELALSKDIKSKEQIWQEVKKIAMPYRNSREPTDKMTKAVLQTHRQRQTRLDEGRHHPTDRKYNSVYASTISGFVLNNSLFQQLQVYFDGTFHCVPLPFKQLLIVMVFCNREQKYVPGIWILLTGKTKRCYYEAISWFARCKKDGEMPDINYTGVDFEPAFFQAIDKFLKDTFRVGCEFHYRRIVLPLRAVWCRDDFLAVWSLDGLDEEKVELQNKTNCIIEHYNRQLNEKFPR